MGAAMIDQLNDTGYATGKDTGGSKSGAKTAGKAAGKTKGAGKLGLKTNSKGKVSQKSTDRLGNFFYKAYECKTKSGSSANDSNGKYDRRRLARTFVLN